MYCFKCGRSIDSDSKFCEFCGARFEGLNVNSNYPYQQNNQGSYNNGNMPYQQNYPGANNNGNAPYPQNYNSGIPPYQQNYNSGISPYQQNDPGRNYSAQPNMYQEQPQKTMRQSIFKSRSVKTKQVQVQSNEMNDLYHKYMDDQYVVDDRSGNSVIPVNPSAIQADTGDNISEKSNSRFFLVYSIIISILSLFHIGPALVGLLCGIIMLFTKNKKYGSKIVLGSILGILIGILFFLITF